MRDDNSMWKQMEDEQQFESERRVYMRKIVFLALAFFVGVLIMGYALAADLAGVAFRP